jgi:hypothetical protein
MTRFAGVYNCQAAMTQRHSTSGSVNRRGSPNTFIVAATMLDGLQHRANVSLSIEADYSGNSTHDLRIVKSET